MGLAKQDEFLVEVPVVKDMAHHDDVGLREKVLEKNLLMEAQPSSKSFPCTYDSKIS